MLIYVYQQCILEIMRIMFSIDPLHYDSETFLKMFIFLLLRDNAMSENVRHAHNILTLKEGGMLP